MVVFNGDFFADARDSDKTLCPDFANDKRVERLYCDEDGNMVVVFREDLNTIMRNTEEVSCSEVCKYINPTDSDKSTTTNLTIQK